jgi:hypothetical protein
MRWPTEIGELLLSSRKTVWGERADETTGV